MTTTTQPTLNEAQADTTTKPVNVFHDRGLSVAVFANKATVRDREMTFFDTSIERTYKDGEGFKKTHTLGKDDLPRAQLLLAQAWEWIVNQEAALRKAAAK
jgi:hypothetical protein